MSLSPLAASYIASNIDAGHKRDCAWGAGADCTCGLHAEDCDGEVVRVFFVTALLGERCFERRYTLYYTFDKDRAVEYARGARDARWRGVKCGGRTMTAEAFAAYEEGAKADMERIRDWCTD